MNSFFGIGIMELFFIAVLAMIVLGPERLPGLIREGAKWMRKIRRLTSDLTSQFSEEMKALDEINPQRIIREMTDPELDEETAKPKPAAKSTAAKPAAKPAPAKTTTTQAKTTAAPAKPAAKPAATAASAAAAKPAPEAAPAAGVQPEPAGDGAPEASAADVPAEAPPPNEDNRILPPQPAPVAAAVASSVVPEAADGAALSPDVAGATSEATAPRKSTIGDPRPLMAQTAAQKAKSNGAPSAAVAANGGQEQAAPDAGSTPATQDAKQPAAAAMPEVAARALDEPSPGVEGGA